MNDPAHGTLKVSPVNGGRPLRDFLSVPGRVHRDDPAWIEPLWLERRFHCSRHNPFFEHARWQAWVARVDGIPVGRISAQVDDLHRQVHGADTGHFGMLDAIDDAAVFGALFAEAEQWLRGQGARRITGPFNFSINQECGLLVEGFEHPPVVMMPHGGRWYPRHVEALGYRPVTDMLAYRVRTDFTPPPVMASLLRRYGSRVQLRPLDRGRFDSELALIRDIFNDAWSGNWGFVPFTEAEFAEVGTSLRLLVPDDFVHIALVEGEPVAFIVALPDINQAMRGLGGRLLPLGWLRFLYRLRRGAIHTGRVALMGVRRNYQNSPLGIALAFLVIQAVKQSLAARGIREVEMSWILDNNKGMRHILEAIGSDLYKRYRVYERILP